jgi:hypothetical protein
LIKEFKKKVLSNSRYFSLGIICLQCPLKSWQIKKLQTHWIDKVKIKKERELRKTKILMKMKFLKEIERRKPIGMTGRMIIQQVQVIPSFFD